MGVTRKRKRENDTIILELKIYTIKTQILLIYHPCTFIYN